MLKEYRLLYEWVSTTYSSGYLTEILYHVYIFRHPQPKANSNGFHRLGQSDLSDNRWWHGQVHTHFLRSRNQ